MIAQVDHAQGARAFSRTADDYLLGLVHDELCAALPALLNPMPKPVVGLPPRVIEQLPPEIVNVVPEHVSGACHGALLGRGACAGRG